MYRTIREMGSKTFLSSDENGRLYILKAMPECDTELAKRLCSVQSPFVARVFLPASLGGELYCVSEYIDGITLEEYINTMGPANDENARRIICDICRGLSALHARGIVHRDITPANIVINRNGRAVIIDFDISRLEKPGKTADTQILGTQGYAAPEQFGFSQTGPRADIYALGVLVNYIKTGKLPNEKQTSGVFRKIVEKCTRMDENDRFSSAGEIVDMLEGRATPANLFHLIPGFRSHRLWHEVVAAVYYIAYALFAGFGFWALSEKSGENILYEAVLFFVFLVPVPLICDSRHWSRRLPLVKSFTNGGRLFARLCAAGVSVILGCALIIIFPNK